MNPQRLIIGGFGLIAIVLVAVVALAPQWRGTTKLSGYIEGEPLYLASPISGRLTRVDVQRGDRVAAGAALFVVDVRTLAAAQAQAAGQIAQARSAVAAARHTRAQLDANVAAARANAAEADREAARAAHLIALGHGAISQQEADKARSAAESAHAALAAAQRQADAAAAQIGGAGGQLSQAEGAGADAAARLDQAAPVAPTAARVEDVFFQVGEWATANQPVISLLPDERVRLRFFVPEREVARYRMGRQVRFGCDGCAAGLAATINYVSPRPEFTPPVIYSLQSRDRLVFLVEARPVNPRGLTPGLPVDVTPLAP
ncbi:MAG TPA: HlyD family efflux transporter periplasmic adaptor subunit [Caulobacteraceae bacterium]|jgi:HlyD family secretion protein|nr:HlyD family efflux transporter periplasmic adaptor subunit [Caulobacteraceae bacterium]